jgi:hypothetical protein
MQSFMRVAAQHRFVAMQHQSNQGLTKFVIFKMTQPIDL